MFAPLAFQLGGLNLDYIAGATAFRLVYLPTFVNACFNTEWPRFEANCSFGSFSLC